MGDVDKLVVEHREAEKLQERRRTNFSMTSKGVVSCETTFESNCKTNEETITEAGKLFTLAQAVCNEKNKQNI